MVTLPCPSKVSGSESTVNTDVEMTQSEENPPLTTRSVNSRTVSEKSIVTSSSPSEIEMSQQEEATFPGTRSEISKSGSEKVTSVTTTSHPKNFHHST